MYDHEIASRTPLLFAISTCPRCQRVKSFLKDHGVHAHIVDVDLLTLSEKRQQFEFVRRVNPEISFPTLVVGDTAVLGEDYDGIKEALNL
ncbi:glutaredoxin family protein [Candidatus Fermentibacteria bacterium]|nr:glutaredoxin family protein [Candidatus Fermentibacteria bacterium]